eukprot:CAMPEP_0197717898 /NCGR_PEP_ID=MMETSP1434-20131217/2263_1 /TAXON_ID=265543 /ORGANISM="Minutocellus polymorphus, Strain CCMP3303" /LENGTH=138 /DNA_ID=CAMNT_0043302479 /DNA_START=175 /DNA_END=591 /DNA_ORIENTATION=+
MTETDGCGRKAAAESHGDTHSSLAPKSASSSASATSQEESNVARRVMQSASQVNQSNSAEDDIDNDPEVILLTKFRLALGSTLRMLECARDDLVRLGERMDRLTVASRECRERLEAQQAQQHMQNGAEAQGGKGNRQG